MWTVEMCLLGRARHKLRGLREKKERERKKKEKTRGTNGRERLLWPTFVNAVHFRRGLTCTLGLTKDLIDGGQPRVKPLCKAKPNLLLAFGWPPSIKSLVNPRVHVRPRLK